MDSYTIKNLKQLENMAERFDVPGGFEARFARQALNAERIGLSHQRLGPNAKGPFGHTHGQDEEVYVVVGGSGRVKLDDEVVEVGAWDAIRIAPETFRAFAAGPDGLELLAFGTHTEDDTKMKEADWPEDG